MTVDGTLTARQQEIKDRLEQEMSAVEIASDLGITRNAVYQQIQAMRRKGELPPAFTPSGSPPRGTPMPGGSTLVEQQAGLLAHTVVQLRSMADEIEAQIGAASNR